MSQPFFIAQITDSEGRSYHFKLTVTDAGEVWKPIKYHPRSDDYTPVFKIFKKTPFASSQDDETGLFKLIGIQRYNEEDYVWESPQEQD